MKTGLETAVEIPARMVNRTVKRSGSAVDTSPGRGPRQSEPVEPTGLVEPTEPMEPAGTRGTAETWDGLNVSFPPLRPPETGDSRPGEMGTAPGTPEDPPPAAPTPSPEALSAQIDPAAQVLAVTGARGGLGVSVLLLHLAWALSRAGRRVAMMDLDPAGGLDLLCGETVLNGLRWADLPAEESAFRPGRLVGALPVWHAMPVLTGDIRGGPLACADAVLEAMRAEHDIVLVDLPRGAPPPRGARVLLMTGLDLRSAVAAEAIAPRLRGPSPDDGDPSGPDSPPVWLVVRQVGEDIATEDLELITGCPVLGRVPTDRVLAKRLALGEDPVRARSAARRAATALARELFARVLIPEVLASAPVAAERIAEPGGASAAERGSEPWPR